MRNGWNKAVLGILAVLSGGLLVIAFAAPLFQHFRGYPHGEEFYRLLNPICHQYPTRSLWLFGHSMGLCTRCFAGYSGILLATIFWRQSWSYRRRFITGLILLGIALVDPLIQLNSSYLSSSLMRISMGTLGGLGVSLLLFPVFPVSQPVER